MRIPVAQSFGNEVARYGPTPVSQSLDGGVGAAVGRLGAEGTQLVSEEMRQEKKRQIESQRADAALVLAQTENDAHDAHDAIVRGLADGTVDPTQARTELGTRIAKLRDERFQPLNPEQRGAISDNLMRTQGTLERNLQGVIVKRQQSDTAATIDQFGEQKQRDAMRVGPAVASSDFDAMVDFSGSAAGWSPEVQAAKKQRFREGAHYAFFDAAGVEALTTGDPAKVGNVLAAIKGPDGEALDPQRRVQLTHQVFGFQQSLLAKQARDANAVEQERVRRENEAVVAYNQTLDVLVSGGVLSPTAIKDATAAATGTKHEADMGSLLAGQSTISGFATKTQAERDAILLKWRTDRSSPNVGTDTPTEKQLGALTTINDKIAAGIKDDPWEAASKAGRVQSAPLDVSSPTSLIAGVQRRMSSISDLEVWTGKPESPLKPDEAAKVSKLIHALPPDQASSVLGSIGASLGDSERAGALAKQIHDKDHTLGMAMAYANQGTTEGRLVGELILRGQKMIDDKIVKPDGIAETGWRATIAKTIRGAYATQTDEDRAVDAAFLIAAVKGGDLENAVRLATGGGIIDFNGAKVPMPAGYAVEGEQSGAEKKFRKAIASIPPEQLMPQAVDGNVYANGVPMRASDFLESLKDAKLVHAGGNSYAVQAGNGLVKNRDGRRITLTLP